jgi:hypothetical protein
MIPALTQVTDYTGLQGGQFQSVTHRPVNTRENQMAKDKHKIIKKSTQCNLASSKLSSSITTNLNNHEKEDNDLKSHLMKMIDAFKES